MSSADDRTFEDQTLIRYLLGSLNEAEAEKLDELSISDDSIAWRLESLENDFMDAYVLGELADKNLIDFRNRYLSSPDGLSKVALAEAIRLHNHQRRAAAIATTGLADRAEPRAVLRTSLWRRFSDYQPSFQWVLASGLAMLLFVAYLLAQNARLHRRLTGSELALNVASQRNQDSRPLDEQTITGAPQEKLDSNRESTLDLSEAKLVAALLLPPTRGAKSIQRVSVPAGTDLVVVSMVLEADEFPSYRVSLRNRTANQVIWYSGKIIALSNGSTSTVSVNLPVRLLTQGNYVLELSGFAPSGGHEVIADYPLNFIMP